MPPAKRKAKLAGVAQLVGTIVDAMDQLPIDLHEQLLEQLNSCREMLSMHDRLLTVETEMTADAVGAASASSAAGAPARQPQRQHRDAAAATASQSRQSPRGGTQLARLREINAIVSDPSMGDGLKVIDELRSILAKSDDMSEEEKSELKKIMESMKQRNASLRARADGLRRQREHMIDSAQSTEQSGLGRQIEGVLSVLGAEELSSMPLENQVEVLSMGFDLIDGLSEAETRAHAPLVKRLIERLKVLQQRLSSQARGMQGAQVGAARASPKQSPRTAQPRQGAAQGHSPQRSSQGSSPVRGSSPAAGGRAGSPAGSPRNRQPAGEADWLPRRIVETTHELRSAVFASLPKRERAEKLVAVYRVLNKLPDDFPHQHPRELSELLGALQEQQEQISGQGSEDRGGDEEESEESEGEKGRGGPKTIVDLLPKMYVRLSSDDFASTTSKYELETITWVLTVVGEMAGSADAPPHLDRMVAPIHELLAQRLDQLESLPNTTGMRFGALRCDEVGAGHWEVHTTTTGEDPEKSAIIRPAEPSGYAARCHRTPAKAVLLATLTPDGCEGLEVRRLASLLTKVHGFDCTVLTGGACRADAVREALLAARAAAEPDSGRIFVFYRSNLEQEPTDMRMQDGESLTLDAAMGKLPQGAAIVLDLFDKCVFATPGAGSGQLLTLTIADDAAAPGVIEPPCNYLFDGIFTPVLAQVLAAEEDSPETLAGLFRAVQFAMTADGPQIPEEGRDPGYYAAFDAAPIACGQGEARNGTEEAGEYDEDEFEAAEDDDQ